MRYPKSYLPLIVTIFLLGCEADVPTTASPEPAPAPEASLPSWNDGAAQQAIIDFIDKTTTEGSPDFIPMADRIAVFDNDGTLWSEQPIYFQLAYAIDFIKKDASNHPDWVNKEPYKVCSMVT
jgi:hypothetical protein